LRFSIASLFFVCLGFVFFALWAFFSMFLNEIYTALYPTAPTGAMHTLDLVPTAFGVICAIFFVTGILLIFILDSFAEEPEMYWRRY